MREDASCIRVGELLRQAYDRMLRLAAGNAGMAAVPHLAVSLEQASLLQVADLRRYDTRGTYRAIVGRSVCK